MVTNPKKSRNFALVFDTLSVATTLKGVNQRFIIISEQKLFKLYILCLNDFMVRI